MHDGQTSPGALRRLAALAAVALLAAGCGSPDDETLIRQTIDRAREDAVDGDLAGLREILAEDYADAEGRDRDTLLALAAGWLRQYPTRHAMTRVHAVDVSGDTATAVVIVGLAGAAFDGAAGLRAVDGDALRVTLELGRRRGGWRVTAASWTDASPADLL